MKCPACGQDLKGVTIQGVTFDVCDDGCGGIWFDRFELEKVDEPHEGLGEELLRRSPREPRAPSEEQLTCPRCSDRKMFRRFFSIKHQVEIDECPECAGIWLDAGELGIIRSQFESEDERKRAATAYFEEVFGDDLDKMRAQGAEGEERARRIARAFRFLCPSYYLPGKQRWGAF